MSTYKGEEENRREATDEGEDRARGGNRIQEELDRRRE